MAALTEVWPARFINALMLAPVLAAMVSPVLRRSCQRSVGSPARLRAGIHQLESLELVTRLPVLVAKIMLSGSLPTYWAKCCSKASAAIFGKTMVRLLPTVFVVPIKAGLPCSFFTARSIVSVLLKAL